MKNLLLYCICLLAFTTGMQAQSLQIDLQKYDYRSEDFNYSRINLYFLGSTMPYLILQDSTLALEIVTTMVIKDGDDIAYAERHKLTSRADYPTDFTDSYEMQLNPGRYELLYKVKEAHTDSLLYNRVQDIIVKDFQGPDFSDIMLLQSFSQGEKTDSSLTINGVQVEILPFNYVADAYDRLAYYFDYYPDETLDEVFLIEQIDRYEKSEWKARAKKASPIADKKQITPMFKSMSIKDLESGEYRLSLKLVTRSMDTLSAVEVGFIRSNPEADIKKRELQLKKAEESTFVEDIPLDKLRYDLKAITPIVSPTDIPTLNYVLKQNEEVGMRAFLYNFWKKFSPTNPEIDYENYMEVAAAIDKEYNNGMGYGFETDRGRVFLQYGRPTQITTSEQEIASVPYEIWTYDYVDKTNQSNGRFVFYNPSLVHNGYELIHSTVRGEINNPRWELYIYGNAPDEIDGPDFMNSRRMQDNINRNARRFYEDN